MSEQQIVTTYLEMSASSELVAGKEAEDLQLVEVEINQPPFNRYLYELVGQAWQWLDKLSWSDDQWRAYVEQEGLRTWVAWCRGTPAGYFELLQEKNGDTEIAYFGLAPGFIGRGYGGFLLSEAVRAAWAWPGTRRVWLHTCNLDHPHALNNYRARGFRVYREERE